MRLTTENCPGVSEKRLAAINALSDEELRLEVEKGPASRFGSNMQPVLRTALQLREGVAQLEAREVELEIARDSNRIAQDALDEAKIANRKSDWARFWSAVAVLVSAITALVTYLSSI